MEETKEEKTNFLEDLKRVQADFENYIKRTQKDFERVSEQSKAEFTEKLLPVLDCFEASLKNVKENETIKGIRMIYQTLMKTLKEEGLEEINTENAKLNPYFHEAVLKEKSDKEEDAILEEIQRGYTFKGKLLRSSKVKISERVIENE